MLLELRDLVISLGDSLRHDFDLLLSPLSVFLSRLPIDMSAVCGELLDSDGGSIKKKEDSRSNLAARVVSSSFSGDPDAVLTELPCSGGLTELGATVCCLSHSGSLLTPFV